MKRLVLALAGLTLSGAALASEQAMPFRFDATPDNMASLQRGARNFVNYCSGCHSMKHLRFNRLGKDLGIDDALLKSDLMFATDKPGDHIISSMPADAEAWFGQKPPDLSVETRYRGADWVYNYLLTFYVDPARPMGVNNLMLPNASMPHVLWELQGWQVKEEKKDQAAAAHGGEGGGSGGEGGSSGGASSGGEGHEGPGLMLAVPGKLSPEEYQKFVADTVNFMSYAAEPGRAKRMKVGGMVLMYLLVLTVLAYLMKKEWWKDVH
jgi:ubiquinol-cytochrome c reductase cytochrome c1 subunit